VTVSKLLSAMICVSVLSCNALAARADKAWSQDVSLAGKTYTLTLKADRDGAWPREPVSVVLPYRVKNVTLRKGAAHKPLIADNVILLPLTGAFKKGSVVTVVFEADRIVTTSVAAGSELRKSAAAAELAPQDMRPAVRVALGRAGGNRDELIGAIREAKPDQRPAVAFLIANMPLRDLTSLKGAYIRKNVELACSARTKAPWGKAIPEGVFLNDVLPYASINERRDDWRKDFMDRFSASAWMCKTPGEAGAKLNREIFKALKVTYHATKRPKADQSPYESIEAGYASCTGLSILLTNACRAAGIPARMAGTPLWVDRKGNHTWVEVWDNGKWHYLGAWDGKKLDKAWFTGKAAACAATVAADKRLWQHRIFATSFRKTPVHFPMGWDMSLKYVPAVDVTQSYAVKEKTKTP